jgi:hypothetical protein
MTSNITRFVMDVGIILLGRDPQDIASAYNRTKLGGPAIAGFAVGCGSVRCAKRRSAYGR